MEVIYTGLRQTPRQIVEAVIQEDADCLCLSILSGAHNHLVPEVLRLLKDQGVQDVLVVAGGIIPQDDAEHLKSSGVAGIFGPGTPTATAVDFIREHTQPRA